MTSTPTGDAAAAIQRRTHGLTDLDIPYELVVDLVLRRSFLDDTTSVGRLAEAIGLPVSVISVVFEELNQKKFVDVQGLVGQDYVFTLTAFGKEQAAERFKRSKYSSVAPVSLGRYAKVVIAQRRRPQIRRDDVAQAFADLVVSDELIEQVGPAFTAQESLFLYGPSGTGKTSIGERLIRLYNDGILVPRAVEVDGQIITVFDPLVHHPVDPQPKGLDPRWVACFRPIVTVGGELELSMLQLAFDQSRGTYTSPLQMRANNGILFIDDFGRQLTSPRALLNRWIVPLDRRVDYLTLEYGLKFSIPFELMVVFSTNLDPGDLKEDAFFRRIQNKIYVGPVTDDQFDWIVTRAVQRYELEAKSGAMSYLRKVCRERGSGNLLACYPNDLCRLAKAICEFQEGRPMLSTEAVDRAASLYFAEAGGGTGFFRRTLAEELSEHYERADRRTPGQAAPPPSRTPRRPEEDHRDLQPAGSPPSEFPGDETAVGDASGGEGPGGSAAGSGRSGVEAADPGAAVGRERRHAHGEIGDRRGPG
ncbi:MAG: AAA family ATPase [Acidimicrobiales bacterium]